MAIIAKNNDTTFKVEIADLGISIPALSQRDLTEVFKKDMIAASKDLKNLVNNGSITVNDGNQDLSISDGLKHITIQTEWEDVIDIEGRIDLQTIEDHIDVEITNLADNNILSYNQIQNKWINKTQTQGSGKTFLIDLQKNSNNVSNATWLDKYDKLSGSWSGWSSACHCTLIPYNCKIVSIEFILKKASYDWRSTPGNIFFNLTIYNISFNGAILNKSLNLTLQGLFTGNGLPDNSHKWSIDENNFTYLSGNEILNRGDVVGFMFRKDISQPGQIFNVANLHMTLNIMETI